MRKYLLTSVCTLVLSLLGAFGANQNSMSLGQILNSVSNTTQVDQNVTNSEDQPSLPIENNTTDTNSAAVNTDTNTSEVTPQAVSNNDVSDIALSNNDNSNVQADNETTVTSDDSNKAVQTVPVAVKVSTGATKVDAAKAEAIQKIASKYSDFTNNVKANNGKVIVYKNIDLSNCKSAKDVVNQLQKNGYTNITTGNVQNIQSLKDILAQLQGSQSNSNPSTPVTTPVPTTKPTPTTTPAPTTKPAPTTTPTPTTKPTTTNTNQSSFAAEVLRLVNIERAKAGLSAYTTNSTLTSAANKRAQEIVQSFSHTRLNGTKFYTVLNEYGVSYNAAGENIAYGQRTPQEVVTGWMNSPGHRANILNANFHKLGIGVYQSNGTYYWTQEFTN